MNTLARLWEGLLRAGTSHLIAGVALEFADARLSFVFLTACVLGISACAAGPDQAELRARHGSPLYTYVCDDGKSFQQRQIISGEVEVTAGGVTRDVTTADGELVAGGPRIEPVDEATRLTGMPGGPYEACFQADTE